VSILVWSALAACLLGSGLFSGSETGFYSLSRMRVEAAARSGQLSAQIVQRLQRDEHALLVTILVGNNLMLEIATALADDRVAGWSFVPSGARELVLALWLTPLVFFFGELLPKDLFRRRPHTLVPRVARTISWAQVLLWPLSLPLRALTRLAERVAGLEQGLHEGRQAAVLELLSQGTREGTLEAHAERLARNVLSLKNTRLESVLVPWEEVDRLVQGASEAELRAQVEKTTHSRLPVVDTDGCVVGYVHQLDVLSAEPGTSLLATLRPILPLAPEASVDRALARMRTAGQRVALVGEVGAPLGLVALKDLVEEISGDLAGL